MRDFFAAAGLTVQTFSTFMGEGASCSLQYDLDLYVQDDDHRRRLARLSAPEREDLAETLDGSLALHTVYVTRAARAALDPTAPHAILAPMSAHAARIIEQLAARDGGVTVVLRNTMEIRYAPQPLTRAFLAAIDGRRSNAEIAHAVAHAIVHAIVPGGDPSGAVQVLEQVAADLKIPTALHWLVARTANGTRWPPISAALGKLTYPVHHGEPSVLAEAGWRAYAAI